MTKLAYFLLSIIVAVGIIGGYIILVRTNTISTPIKILTIGTDFTTKPETTPATVEGLKISAPSLEFSATSLPKLQTSSLNLNVGSLSGAGTIKNFSVNSDFSYSADTSIPAPAVDITFPTVTIPTTTIPTTPTDGTTTGGATGGTTTGGTTAPTANASTCAQFAGVPSCSYVSDANGQTLCNQCKAAGF